MSEPVKATLVMELNVECPECEHEFDLFQESQNDEGELYRQVLDDDRWKIDADDRLKTYAYCPKCSTPFDVKGVIW
jgi:rubredoxin